MKKWVIAAGAVLILSISGLVYFWIPSNVQFSYRLRIACNARGALRVVADQKNWNKWAPVESPDISYRIQDQNNYVLNIGIAGARDSIFSKLLLVPIAGPDSVDCYWQFEMPTAAMPLPRVRRYLFARDAAGHIGTILGSMRGYLEKKENVYGLNIHPGSTTDSFLLATHSIFPTDPATGQIYGLLDGIRQQITKGGAVETGHPMLNITRLADGQKQVEVAIPVDRQLKGGNQYNFKRMLPGHFLLAEVKGGTHAVDSAMTQLQNYVLDYQLTVMAIPFQSLVTDRSKEPDESKWITWIYYPVY
jgi:hypothetical protein